MKLMVEELYYNSHNFEEENFERFDYIYESVMKNEINEFESEDIIKLCEIFKTPFNDIHPHQYIKIQRITYHIINKIGIEAGFKKLILGLALIPKKHVDEYLNMLLNSYSEKDIRIFKKVLDSSSTEIQNKIYAIFKEIFERTDKYKNIEEILIIEN